MTEVHKVKVKIKFVKRHKYTHTYRYRGASYVTVNHWLRKLYSMCLESATKNRQTVRFDD